MTRFRLGSSQPKARVWRRKHIADGPKGAASTGASKAKVDPPRTASKSLLQILLVTPESRSAQADHPTCHAGVAKRAGGSFQSHFAVIPDQFELLRNCDNDFVVLRPVG